jgi:hypothetical protein
VFRVRGGASAIRTFTLGISTKPRVEKIVVDVSTTRDALLGGEASSHHASPTWPIFLSFGLAAVGLAVGIVGLVEAQKEDSFLAGQCNTADSACHVDNPTTAANRHNDINWLVADRVIAGVGGGVFLCAAALGVYFLVRRGDDSSRAPAAIAVGPRLGLDSLGLQGRF